MRLRFSFYLSIPARLAKDVEQSMLEDAEVRGSTRYNGKTLLKAKLEVHCNRPQTCFTTLDDRLRCLSVLEAIYEVLSEHLR